MDETSVRRLLESALAEEPPIRPIARDVQRAGLKMRRRMRIQRAAGGAAAVVVAGAVIPAVTGAFGNGPRPQTLPENPTGTAYVINSGGGTVTPIDLATNTAGTPIDVPGEPVAMAVTPDGTTAYVASSSTNSGAEPTLAQTVTPVDLTTDTPGKPITLTDTPDAIVVTPDGKAAFIINGFPSRTVTRIDLATKTAGRPIVVSLDGVPEGIAMAPDGTTAYLAIATATTATQTRYDLASFDLATSKLGEQVKLSSGQPDAISIAPDGTTAYVLSQSPSTVITVTPVDLATNTAQTPISFSAPPMPTTGFFGPPLAIAIAPDGMTAYVADGASSTVTPINLATNTPGKPISLSGKLGADAIAISTNGAAAYVANQPSGTVTPINLTTDTPGTPIKIGSGRDSGFEAIVTVP